MVWRGEDDSATVTCHGRGDFVVVGGDDNGLRNADLNDALEHTNDQRKAGEKAERFSGETGGAQSSWDDGKRPHTGRSGN
jgi:hypothetical protein